MPKFPIVFETTFGTYTARERLGEGGAGIVYGGTDSDGDAVAVKVLGSDRLTGDKKRRFRNEIGFLSRTKHQNIVSVVDHGVYEAGRGSLQPFYVMPRYAASLRAVLSHMIPANAAFQLYGQLLDGVEAAHLNGVVHRDLKPENILVDQQLTNLVVADFGVAHFTEDLLVTLVETGADQRLANFQYAAPEQRVKGKEVGVPADIYALGLILNELFTGAVPHGTEFIQIGSVSSDFAFLDSIVLSMLRQNPNERQQSIAELKVMIQKHNAESINLQRLSDISKTVIPEGEIDDPLAFNPPKLIGAEWNSGQLLLTLDRPVSEGWVRALRNMGNFSAVMGMGPERFIFREATASVKCSETDAQLAINHFKEWLPRATQVLKQTMEQEAKRMHNARIDQLRKEKAAEERRLRVNRSLKI